MPTTVAATCSSRRADESDKSFLTYSPEVSIVTSVEPDHLDNYGDEASYRLAFEQFCDRVLPGGFMVVCYDDAGARRLAEFARAKGIDVRTYGESPDADTQVTELVASGSTQSYVPVFHGRKLPVVNLQQAGKHNALNSAAALTVGLGLGLSAADLAEGLAAFTGTGRRFEFKGLEDGVRVFDSYAHHPTEVAVDLAAARTVAGEGRVIVCFQPHLFSRTRIFAADFSEALALADEVVVDGHLRGPRGSRARGHRRADRQPRAAEAGSGPVRAPPGPPYRGWSRSWPNRATWSSPPVPVT